MYKEIVSSLTFALLLSGCGGTADSNNEEDISSSSNASSTSTDHIISSSVETDGDSFTLHATFSSPEYASVASISPESLNSEMKVFNSLVPKVDTLANEGSYSVDVQCKYEYESIASEDYYKLKCDDLNDDSDSVSDRTLKSDEVLTARWNEYGKSEYVEFGVVSEYVSKNPSAGTTDGSDDESPYSDVEKSKKTVFQGTWEGEGAQNDGRDWSIKVDFDKGAILYPSIDCVGTLTLLSEDYSEIEYAEHITSGDCVDNGRIIIEKSSTTKTALEFTWYHSNGIEDGTGYLVDTAFYESSDSDFKEKYYGNEESSDFGLGWDMIVDLKAKTISYKNSNCEANLLLLSESGSTRFYVEDIVSGNCESGRRIEIYTSRNDITLEYEKKVNGSYLSRGEAQASLYYHDTVEETILSSVTGTIWMDKNLGALNIEDEGDHYQWGRESDGHEKENPSVTYELSDTIYPGHAAFIFNSGGDWTTSDKDGSTRSATWNPCPSGFRVPSYNEVATEGDVAVGSFTPTSTSLKNYNPLKLAGSPFVGTTVAEDGSKFILFSHSYYELWTTDPEDITHAKLSNGSTSLRMVGYPVRCIK